ncbi:ABC transporter ATP-binding protein [Sulfodiicoccus acidiphilus]|uniref:ABC transporter ATP-binding protein n=1 Tax=Sulfodiicoccus acidiphilus TaxID=1670455 RepID=A0A348B688_9CREN|nr:ABC transporter ATP-binding protein [Sulfodiicoccus acidiphilus]BBD73690.1 ABC transporter ATP-binding protein [Sulfodiicoccus acidiphilus]GGT97689.1 ABC transporter ATP-binding protein [Sulfodiicoccus acidiphilus]
MNVVVGPNGSGKTTLLKRLAGMRVKDGILNGALSEVRPLLGTTYLPSDLPDAPISVDKFMLAEDTWYPPSREEVEIAKNALSELGVLHLFHRRLDTLSSGERRLVMIAKAMTKGKTLLLDEPTSNLDPSNSFLVSKRVVDISTARTVVVATHDMSLLTLANWIVMIKEGKLMKQCQPWGVRAEDLEELYGVRFVEVEGGGRRFLIPAP